ncbi:MAG: Ig-like domain-containing protein [Eubacterium ventriosum]
MEKIHRICFGKAYVNLKGEYTIAKAGRLKLPTTLKTSERVYYLSDNPAIATVDDAGNVKGIGAGTVTIHGFTAKRKK